MGATSAIDTRRIGWIDLGKMGLPIRERLAAQRFEVATLARNSEGPERATRANLQSASRIRSVVASADIVVSAVRDDAALLDIAFQARRLKETLHASQIFVEMSTVSPSAPRRVAEAMSAIWVRCISSVRVRLNGVGGARSFDGPSVLALPERRRVKDFYAVFTRKTFVVSDGAEARYLKLVLNSLVGGTSAFWRKPGPWVVREGWAMLR